jgi:ethanolamine utilization cobalamin adenosyltransferase
MALGCGLTSVRGNRGKNYENEPLVPQKNTKKKKIMRLQLLNNEVDNYHGAKAPGAVAEEFRVIHQDVLGLLQKLVSIVQCLLLLLLLPSSPIFPEDWPSCCSLPPS